MTDLPPPVDVLVASASAVVDGAQRLGLTWRVLPGTVVTSGVADVSVIVDGDDQPARAQSLIGEVYPDLRVMLMIVPPQGTYIIGLYGGSRTGFIDELTRIASVGTFTAETLLDQITFTASSRLRYKLTWCGTVQSSVANDAIRIIFRWEQGATLTTAGTSFTSHDVNADVAGRGMLATIPKTVTGLPDGEASIGVLALRASGTGNITAFADANREATTLLEVYR